MERGLATLLETPGEHPHRAHDNRIIALHVHQGFPEMQLAEETVRRGLARWGESAVWVVAETDRVTCDLLARLEVAAVYLPLNPHWTWEDIRGSRMKWIKRRKEWIWTVEGQKADHRRLMRDREILRDADDILVFLPVGSSSWWDTHADRDNVHIIRRGKLRKR